MFHPTPYLFPPNNALVIVSAPHWRKRDSEPRSLFCLWYPGTNSSWVRSWKANLKVHLPSICSSILAPEVCILEFLNLVSSTFTGRKVNYGVCKNILPKWEIAFLLTFPLLNCCELSYYHNSFTARSCTGFHLEVNLVLGSDILN